MLLEAWRSLWELHPRREVGPLQRLLVASLLAVALALGLMSFVAVFGRIDRPGWWWASLLPNIGICLCIVHTLFGVLWLGGRWLPAPLAERMANVRDIRAGMALSALALGGIILGMTIGVQVKHTPVLAEGYPYTGKLENVGVHPNVVNDYMTKENLLQNGAPFVKQFLDGAAAYIRQLQ